MRRVSILVFASLTVVCALPVLGEGKPRVGVAEFRNETSAAWWYGGAGNDLSSMLTNELASTEKF